MDNAEKSLSGQEGLEIIQRMINQAKQQYSDDSFMYLLWGWLVFAASIGHYLLDSAGIIYAPMVWLLMPVGGIISAIWGHRKNKSKPVKTYIDEFNKYVLTAFLVSLCIVLFSMQRLQLNCYPMVMMVYGVWLYISGGCLKFKPIMLGGIANWILAVAAFFVDFKMQLLLLAFAVLIGYIIPGYMLRNRFKNQQA